MQKRLRLTVISPLNIRHICRELESVTENRRYIRFSPNLDSGMISSAVNYRVRSWRDVYVLKIGAKSFGDGSREICKDTENNLGPVATF